MQRPPGPRHATAMELRLGSRFLLIKQLHQTSIHYLLRVWLF